MFALEINLDTAFGLIVTGKKAIEIYKIASSMGGVKKKFNLSQLIVIANNFGMIPAEDIIA